MTANPTFSSKRLTLSTNSHPHTITNKSMNIDDDFDCVKVEISDLDSACPNQTTLSLMKCKKKIIIPFRKLLCLIGWRPFGVDSLKPPSVFLRIINIVYPIFIFILLLFNYTYEIILCQGKLNVITDTQTTTTTTTSTTTSSFRNHSVGTWAPLVPGTVLPTHDECGHIFTTYILPDIFHCLAFIIGLIHFRITEGEPLYSLMEKVFISADQNFGMSNTNRAIRRLNLFMLISVIWVITSVATNAFYNGMNDFAHTFFFGEGEIIIKKDNPVNYVLFVIDIICLLISNCIHVAVIMNYMCHCEMIVFYCKAIRLRLEEKSIHLLESMKRILDLGASISQLNSAASRMMSILIILFLERSILGLMLLILNRVFDAKMWVYRSLYVVIWLSILSFCLAEASRVANKCDKFCRLSLSMRVYGYHNATPSELDGFLLFISRAELRVKLFGLTVRPGKIICIGITALLVLVVLFQTGIASSETFFF